MVSMAATRRIRGTGEACRRPYELETTCKFRSGARCRPRWASALFAIATLLGWRWSRIQESLDWSWHNWTRGERRDANVGQHSLVVVSLPGSEAVSPLPLR